MDRQKNRRQVLVFEWLCGGGLLYDAADPDEIPGLIYQGQQMLQAVCSDFERAGCDVIVPIDARIAPPTNGITHAIAPTEGLRQQLVELAKTADYILAIAPETDGHLEKCLDWFAKCSAVSLNPGLEFTRLCCNKNQTQHFLSTRDVPVPHGCRVGQWEQFRSQLSGPDGFILKPADGCGGEHLRFYESVDSDLVNALSANMRIEEFVPGVPVSVAAITGQNGNHLFPAMRQVFDDQPVGHFVRCVDDLEQKEIEKAQRLAEQTIDALPTASGYFGIDMVIGKRDVVVEVNPRITMSYPMLRKKLKINLGEQMLQATLT